MTGQPPNLNQDILQELRNINRSANVIQTKIRQAIDPFERTIAAFTKASEQQVRALSMGFKASGFGKAFSEVEAALTNVVPALDAVDIAATLLEGGLKEVNEISKKTGQLTNKNIVMLGARMKATGQDYKMLATTFLPLTAELALNTEQSDNLAKAIEENSRANLTTAENLLKFMKALPGAKQFGLVGLGDEFAVAAGGLKTMFPQYANQIDTVLQAFFSDVIEGGALAARLGVFDKFKSIEGGAISQDALAELLTAASKVSIERLKGLPLGIAQRIGESYFKDPEVLYAMKSLSTLDLFKKIPKNLEEEGDKGGQDFKKSILNQLEQIFDPFAMAMQSLIPVITQNEAVFQTLFSTIATGMALAKGDRVSLALLPLLPIIQDFASEIRNIKNSSETAEKYKERFQPLIDAIMANFQSMPPVFPPTPVEALKPIEVQITPETSTGVTPKEEKPITPTEKVTPSNATGSRGRGAFLGPLEAPNTLMPEQLAKSIQGVVVDRMKTETKNAEFMNVALTHLKDISESNQKMANEKPIKQTKPLDTRVRTNATAG